MFPIFSDPFPTFFDFLGFLPFAQGKSACKNTFKISFISLICKFYIPTYVYMPAGMFQVLKRKLMWKLEMVIKICPEAVQGHCW